MAQAEKELNLPSCVLCGEKVERQKSFMCRKCRETPFCLEHLDREHKMCPGCAAEKRIKHYNDLLHQEKSIRSFMRLAQFVFMVSAFLFAAGRFYSDYVPDLLKDNIFYKYVYIWGGLAVSAVFLCFIMLYSQKQKVREVEDKIQDHRVDSRYMRR